MGHSRYIIIVFVFLLYITVVPVSGFIGDSAVLPCTIPQGKIQDFKVHWRDDEGKNVFDIIGGNAAVEDQAPEYKNRVEAFPDEQRTGNVSIKLNNLQKTDARKYSCIITGPFQHENIIELHVKDRPVAGRGNHGGLYRELTWIVSLLIVFICSLL